MTPRRLIILALMTTLAVAHQAQAQDSGVGMTKVLVPGPSYLGGLIEFEITVTNESESIARGVTVVEDLPEGLSVVDVDPSSGWYDHDRDEWVVGNLEPGQSQTLTVRTVRWLEASVTNCAFARYMTGGGDSLASSAACATVEPAVVPPGDLVSVRTR